jgi:hypothetical protein
MKTIGLKTTSDFYAIGLLVALGELNAGQTILVSIGDKTNPNATTNSPCQKAMHQNQNTNSESDSVANQ